MIRLKERPAIIDNSATEVTSPVSATAVGCALFVEVGNFQISRHSPAAKRSGEPASERELLDERGQRGKSMCNWDANT